MIICIRKCVTVWFRALMAEAAVTTVSIIIGQLKRMRAAIQFLLDVLNKDFETANVELLDVCKGYSRIDRSMYVIEDICIPAHGLFCGRFEKEFFIDVID